VIVSANGRRCLTIAGAARRWRVRPCMAAQFVEHFVASGFVERVADNAWVVTDLGVLWSRALDELAHEVLEIDS
jgi:hypothetical protein